MSDARPTGIVVAQGTWGDVHAPLLLGGVLVPALLLLALLGAAALAALPTAGPFRIHPGIAVPIALVAGMVLFVRSTRGSLRCEGRATLSGRRIRVVRSTGIAVVPLSGLEGYLLGGPTCVLLVRRGATRPDERLSIPTLDVQTRDAVLDWLDAAGLPRLD